MTAIFLQGNAKDVLRGLPGDYFHCAVTSPPYFGLRRYEEGVEDWGDWKGQLGSEPTPDLYIQHLVQICQEVKRVLRPDGVFWLNCGDSWAGGKGQSGGANPDRQAVRHDAGVSLNRECDQLTGKGQTRVLDDRRMLHNAGIKPLDMVLIPSLLALALRTDGWYVRSQVVWSKSNPMPESVNGWRFEKHKVKVGDNWQECPGCPKCSPNDGLILRKGSWRPTDSYEIILMLTKTDSYYCDREAVLEPIAPSTVGRGKVEFGGAKGREYNPDEEDPNFRNGSEQWGRTYDYTQSNGSGGRNLRSVWSFPTKPYSGAHFATYPPRLVEICVQSSTSEKGCCPACGSPWARVVDKGLVAHDGDTDCAYPVGTTANRLALLRQAARERGEEYSNKSSTIGWSPTCSCPPAEPDPCRVLDPFSGAGTTALVCERLGLFSIGIDTSAKYIELARTRLVEDEQKRAIEANKKAKRGKELDLRPGPVFWNW